jgi:asparagine synthetase B (glutamine-hydrolysing)
MFNFILRLRKKNTLKQTFLPIRKGLDESKMNKRVIYKIPCIDCDHVYIGETSRDRKKRVEEHHSAIKRDDDKSELAQHANTKMHKIDLDNVETLGKEGDRRRRVIKESLHTQEHREKTIN